MAEIGVDRGVQPTLRSRGAGQSAIQRCLELQRDASERGSLARALGRNPLHPDAVADYRAALAEIETGRRLSALGADFTVLHSVPVGEEDEVVERRPVIGQLVIGPGGVFCVGSAMSLTASEVDRVALEARLAARHLSRALQRVIAVTPVLAIAGGWSPTPGDPQPAVDVVPARVVVAWLSRRGRVLTTAELAVLAMAAEQPTTWSDATDALGALAPRDASAPLGAPASPEVPGALDPSLAARFRDLDIEVDAASTRRQLVLVIAAVVTIAVWLGVAASVVTSLDPQVFAH